MASKGEDYDKKFGEEFDKKLREEKGLKELRVLYIKSKKINERWKIQIDELVKNLKKLNIRNEKLKEQIAGLNVKCEDHEAQDEQRCQNLEKQQGIIDEQNIEIERLKQLLDNSLVEIGSVVESFESKSSNGGRKKTRRKRTQTKKKRKKRSIKKRRKRRRRR